MTNVDLEYVNCGMFVKFIPMSENGKNAYNDMLKYMGTNCIYTHQKRDFIAQLRREGYVVTADKNNTKQKGKNNDR